MTISEAGGPGPREEQRLSFGRVAELYDLYRPGYPEEMVDAIVAQSGIPARGRVLDIGSGTGKAAAPFVRRGYRVLCVEPDAQMAAVGRRVLGQLAGQASGRTPAGGPQPGTGDQPHEDSEQAGRMAFAQVAFATSSFEDWPLAEGEFDLVCAGQAFHWVAQQAGLVKAAHALRAGGCLALFWNRGRDLRPDLAAQLDEAYRQYAPHMFQSRRDERKPAGLTSEALQEGVDQIALSSAYTPARVSLFPWDARYSTAEYLGLLGTYSDHIILPDDQRRRLFAAVAEIIDGAGGAIDRPYTTVLFLAARKTP